MKKLFGLVLALAFGLVLVGCTNDVKDDVYNNDLSNADLVESEDLPEEESFDEENEELDRRY
ncbi:MAG: hypothetical protein MJ232_07420 [archaeon]|nr:hypothetical protein [archaeon]